MLAGKHGSVNELMLFLMFAGQQEFYNIFLCILFASKQSTEDGAKCFPHVILKLLDMMMVYRSEVGRIGEDIACDFLKGKGYRILGRNIKERFGEIDILAKDTTGALVFIEVKTATGARKSFTPEQHFNKAKATKSKRIAVYYAAKNEEMVNDAVGWRVDLVTILIKDPFLSDVRKDCDIHHYENV